MSKIRDIIDMPAVLDRRRFLSSTLLSCMALVSLSDDSTKRKPLLAFATLGCPDWSFAQMIEFASKHGYDGIEFRGIEREFDLTKHPAFSNDARISVALALARSKHIKIAGLGSSVVLHHREKELRRKNIDEAKRFVDLAVKLDCSMVRVFPDKYSAKTGKETSRQLIAEGMSELAEYALPQKVDIILSTHGDVVSVEDVEAIMGKIPYANTGIGWDIVNMWYAGRQSPAFVYPHIRKYIKIVHVKDMSFKNGKETNVLLGRGEVPVFEGINALLNDGYKGYFSFVWEKHWFPEIEEPETAFADYIRVMNNHVNKQRMEILK